MLKKNLLLSHIEISKKNLIHNIKQFRNLAKKLGLAVPAGFESLTDPVEVFNRCRNLFSDGVIEYATNASVGSTIPYVRWDALSTYQISMHPDNLIRKFDAFVQPMINQIKINSNQSRTLASIRDTLLPKLLSGEIRAKDN